MRFVLLLRAIFVALAFAAAGAQLACASVDLAGPGHNLAAHPDEADHGHDDGAACVDACIAHHLVVTPASVTLFVSTMSPRWDTAAPARFATRRTAPPYSPPKDLSV